MTATANTLRRFHAIAAPILLGVALLAASPHPGAAAEAPQAPQPHATDAATPAPTQAPDAPLALIGMGWG